jgi:uncharacterized protein YbbK (DUF523 family)
MIYQEYLKVSFLFIKPQPSTDLPHNFLYSSFVFQSTYFIVPKKAEATPQPAFLGLKYPGKGFSGGYIMEDKIKIGVSACLLGQKVRFDGGHKHDRFITDTLGQYLEFCPVCPEVEAGFPVPRESFRLVGDRENPRLKTVKTNVDHTDRMLKWAQSRVRELEKENLCGFIFKSKSPSSGMERVKVYSEKGIPEKTGVGIFARVFMDNFPLIPVEEEGRLHDPKLRENFIESIFVLKNWRKTKEKNRNVGTLWIFIPGKSFFCFLTVHRTTEVWENLWPKEKNIPWTNC